MNWKLCVTDPQKHALELCYGSMDKGDGVGGGNGYDYCTTNCNGDGFGSGSSDGRGDGSSPREWK